MAKTPTPSLRQTAPWGWVPGSHFARPGTTTEFSWLRSNGRTDLLIPPPEIALAQEDVEAGADDDGGADDGCERWHVAEHDEAEDHRPDDHRILIGHHDAGRCEF